MKTTLTACSLVATFFSLFCTTVAAQCGGGINTGGGNCTPPNAPGMPGYDSSTQETGYKARVMLPSQWGAIALDDDGKAAGTVNNQPTRRDAISLAIDQCASKGGLKCKLIMAYDNDCAAVAWSPGHYFTSAAADVDQAEHDSMRNCNADQPSCKIVYSGCSIPGQSD